MRCERNTHASLKVPNDIGALSETSAFIANASLWEPNSFCHPCRCLYDASLATMPPGSKRSQASSHQPPAKKSKRSGEMAQDELREFIPRDVQDYVRGSKVSPLKLYPIA
jgi:hypothetical protein